MLNIKHGEISCKYGENVISSKYGEILKLRLKKWFSNTYVKIHHNPPLTPLFVVVNSMHGEIEDSNRF